MSEDFLVRICNSVIFNCSSSLQATRRIYSLTSLCLLSHHPFQSNLVKCLAALKQLVDACDFALGGGGSPKRQGGDSLETFLAWVLA